MTPTVLIPLEGEGWGSLFCYQLVYLYLPYCLFRFSTKIEDLILQQLLAPSEPFSKLPNPILITLLSFRHPYSPSPGLSSSEQNIFCFFLNACL